MKRHSTKSLCDALNIEWDGSYFDIDGAELFDNYVPYGGGCSGSKNGHYGCKHTDEAKRIMSAKKKGITPWNKNIKGYFYHSEEAKKSMSQKLSGSKNGRALLDETKVSNIIELYLSKPELECVGKVSKNGIKMSYIWAFCNHVSKEYSVTPAAIKRILTKKSWKNVWKKYEISNKDQEWI